MTPGFLDVKGIVWVESAVIQHRQQTFISLVANILRYRQSRFAKSGSQQSLVTGPHLSNLRLVSLMRMLMAVCAVQLQIPVIQGVVRRSVVTSRFRALWSIIPTFLILTEVRIHVGQAISWECRDCVNSDGCWPSISWRTWNHC